MSHRIRRTSVLATVLFVGLVAATGSLSAQGTKSAPLNSTYQFFNEQVFTHLTDKAPVYKTVSYSQLLTILESDATSVILFGGAWCPNTQAVIGQINDVAKEYGVKTVYNFDFRLDNAGLHIRDTKNPYANLYVDLVNKYLSNVVTLYAKDKNNVSYTDKDGVVQVANKIQVPFVFAYNKNHKDAQGKAAPIIASYEKMFLWDDFVTNGKTDAAKIEAYKKEVRPVFEAISKTVNGKKVAQVDAITSFGYFQTAYNQAGQTTILDDKDKDWKIQTVSYFELTKILESPGNYAILFGGSWCPNTRAVIKLVNEYARKYDIDTVYNFDTRLDANVLHIRDTKNTYAGLYVDLVNKYFPGIVTEYQPDKVNISYTDKDGKTVSANKLQVPYFFIYNKDRKDAAGKSAPIYGQVELMYTWKDIQPDYVNEKNEKGTNYKTYTAALDQVLTGFKVAKK